MKRDIKLKNYKTDIICIVVIKIIYIALYN